VIIPGKEMACCKAILVKTETAGVEFTALDGIIRLASEGEI
jgi:hypothetical protein